MRCGTVLERVGLSISRGVRDARLEQRADAVARDTLCPLEELEVVLPVRTALLPGLSQQRRRAWVVVLTNYRFSCFGPTA